MKLPDLLPSGLRVVFCGSAAGHASARAGAYYAGRGNRFWSTLYDTGLTPEEIAPADYQRLPEWGIGLTDVCKIAQGMDREIAANAFDAARLHEVISEASPTILAFNGINAACMAFGLSAKTPIAYGLQTRSVADVRTWVLPSTSGAAAASWDFGVWQQLAHAVSESER